MTEECLICAKHRGAGPLVAPVVWQDDLVVVSHAGGGDEPVVLGHLVVESRRHAAYLDGLTEEEAAAVGRAVRAAAVGLRAELDVEAVHAAVVNRRMEHFHEHVLVRHRGTPDEYEWHRVDEWSEAPAGDQIVVAHLCGRLRGYFPDPPAAHRE